MANRREEYLEKLLHEVKFFPDRARIRAEYEAHWEDAVERLRCEGKTPEEADALAAERMGDPVETGKALNRAHSPLLGWLLYLSRALLALLCLALLLPAGLWLSGLLPNSSNSIDALDMPLAWEIEGEWKLMLDGECAIVRGIAQSETGTLYVSVQTFYLPGMQSTFVCGGEQGRSSGYTAHSTSYWESRMIALEDFPTEQNMLYCRIGANGRYKTLEIPLPVGKEAVP